MEKKPKQETSAKESTQAKLDKQKAASTKYFKSFQSPISSNKGRIGASWGGRNGQGKPS